MNNDMILWRRLSYMLSPQLDLYKVLAPHVAGKSVLEVGFCTGFGTLQYALQAREVTALETDAGAVNYARHVLPLLNVLWLDMDILESRASQLYQVAIMIEVLEHIEDWRLALTNVERALVPGGKLYISARNANADLRRNELHAREWTACQFKQALSEFFPRVELFDYTLTREQDVETHLTPLIAVCTK